MNKILALMVVTILCLGGVAKANVFDLGPGLTSLEMVTVGDPGNAGELSDPDLAGVTGPAAVCGAVDYVYSIGKYEVTNAQYVDFLNAKAKSNAYHIYDLSMWSAEYGYRIQQTGTLGNYTYTVAADWANKPVSSVGLWDSLRFVNWLNNGQGNGDTETGAYTLNGYMSNDGRNITRNPGATWFLPSEDEWYKAAYYKGGGTNAGYWDYATRSNSAPSHDVLNPDPGNSANYWIGDDCVGSPYYLTDVGEFEHSASAYGTFDQSGNVWEWNDTKVQIGTYTTDWGLRGGAWGNDHDVISATCRYSTVGIVSGRSIGFRVAGIAAVPEPSSLIVLGSGLVSLLAFRRRLRK